MRLVAEMMPAESAGSLRAKADADRHGPLADLELARAERIAARASR